MLAGHARHDLSFNTCIVFINVAGFFQNNDQAIHRVHNRGGGGGGLHCSYSLLFHAMYNDVRIMIAPCCITCLCIQEPQYYCRV